MSQFLICRFLIIADEICRFGRTEQRKKLDYKNIEGTFSCELNSLLRSFVTRDPNICLNQKKEWMANLGYTQYVINSCDESPVRLSRSPELCLQAIWCCVLTISLNEKK